jgi:hypothetical protein
VPSAHEIISSVVAPIGLDDFIRKVAQDLNSPGV